MTLLSRDALIEQRQLHILHGGLETYQVERLENKAYQAVTVLGSSRLAEVFDQCSCQAVLALVVVVEDA